MFVQKRFRDSSTCNIVVEFIYFVVVVLACYCLGLNVTCLEDNSLPGYISSLIAMRQEIAKLLFSEHFVAKWA